MRRKGPSVAGARQFRAFAGAAPAGVLTHSTHSGCVGAPPGGTRAACQELADDGRTGPADGGGRCADKAQTEATV